MTASTGVLVRLCWLLSLLWPPLVIAVPPRPVFVLNRASDAARRATSLKELSKLGLEPRFLSAKTDSSAPSLESRGDSRARVRGCYLSHRAAWAEVARSWEAPTWQNFGREGAGWSLVFEDDVTTHPNTSAAELEQVLRETADNGVGLVQLGFCFAALSLEKPTLGARFAICVPNSSSRPRYNPSQLHRAHRV